MANPRVLELEARFRRRLPSLQGLVRRYVRHPEDVRDILQTAWVNAQRWLEENQPPGKWDPWLNSIAINVALAHRRRAKREDRRCVPMLDLFDAPDPNPGQDDLVDRSRLRTWLEQLAARKPEQAAAVRLVHLQERTYVEAAGILGIPEGTVKARVSRGLVSLRLSLTAKAA